MLFRSPAPTLSGSFAVSVSVGAGPAPEIFPQVPGIANITLAGAGDGSWIGSDSSPLNSPVQAPAAVAAGQVVQVSASGSVSGVGPDGNISSVASSTSFFGISRITGPRYGLIGVFLGPDVPSPSATPANADFSAAAARDQATLNPLLQQPFYIGRGRTSGGDTKNFVVPSGATRLFLAVLDTGDSTTTTAARLRYQ